MLSNTDYDRVTSYLKSLNINFSEKWVSECISYFKGSNKFITTSELNNSVYQRWCLTDLRDFKTGSFPSNLASSNKVILNGRYVVQVESMVDCSKSSYSELKKLQKTSESTDIGEGGVEEATSKRCLLFSLCDGVTEIHAMEYQPIPNIILNGSDFLPGFKMLLIGPIVCRKGMLLLKKDNVRIYGGKVESLCQTNSFKALMIKNLGLNSNSDEITVHQETVTKDNEKNFPTFHPVSNVEESRAINSFSEPELDCIFRQSDLNELLSENDDFLAGLSLDSRSFTNDISPSKMSQNNAEFASDIFRKPNMNTCNKFLTEENENHIVNYSLNSDLEKNEVILDEFSGFETNKKPRIDKQIVWNEKSCQSKKSVSDNRTCIENEDNIDDQSFQSNIDLLNSTTVKGFNFNYFSEGKKKLPRNVKAYPYVYLKQVAGVFMTKPRTFIVKAMIFTLKSKISIKNDTFSLKASISDGSYTVQADFSSDVLENILEYSPFEISSLLNEKNKNSGVCERLRTIFFFAQQKLMSMNCLMEIKFFNDGHDPLVVGLEEIKMTHLNALKERMM